MTAAISCTRLSRHFGSTRAVDGLDLRIERGEIFGLLGHNGAGKTTTVRLLNGLLEPTEGSAVVLGLDPLSRGSELRARTGVSTETPSVDERMTGLAALRYFAELYGVAPDRVSARCRQLLAEFGLEEAADTRVGAYSKGMKQRLALARTLLHEPELLFLDEPTSGLDPVASRAVTDRITEMSRESGRTVLLCTHNLVQAQELCDRVAVLERGRLVALGAPRQLARELAAGQRLTIELDPEQVELARDWIGSALTGVELLGSSGEELELAVASREAVPQIVSSLVGKGVRVYAVRAQEPSLEDVYFSLHEQGSSREGSLGGTP